MTTDRKRLIVALAAAAAIGAVAIAGSKLASREARAGIEVIDKVRLVDDRKLPEQWLINAAYGRGALSNLRAAFSEIENHNTEQAKKDVAVARSLLAKIKPGAASGDGSRPEWDHILVHSEVRVLGNVDPANSVQWKLDNIRHDLEMNDHQAIIEALGSLNIPLAYTRIDLPLSETIDLVNESLRALETQDVAQARVKLMQIGDGLHIETVKVGAGGLPLDPIDEDDAS